MKRTIAALLLSTSAAFYSYAQPGFLDTGFNGKGVKAMTFASNISTDSIAASVVQPDGKLLVVVKGSYSGSVVRNESSVIRLNADGSYDNTFGLGGRTALSSFVDDFYPTGMTLRSDGRIVICGAQNQGVSNPCLVGLKADGAKDERFGDIVTGTTRCGFKLVNDGDYYSSYTFQTVQVDPVSGNIFAAASRDNETGYDFVLACVNAFGDFEYTFYNGEGYSYMYSYSLADANKHLVCSSVYHANSRVMFIGGTVSDESAGTRRFAVLAFNTSTGKLYDPFAYNVAWQEGGRLVLPLHPEKKISQCTAMAFTPDSLSLILSGYAQAGYNAPDVLNVDFMVCKVNRLGVLDPKFGGDGMATYRYPSSVQNYAFSLAVQPSGKLLIGGSIGTGNSFAAVMRINADSTIDQGFGNNGYVIYNQSSEFINSFKGVARLHDLKGSTKFLLLGSYLFGSNYDAYAKRINNNGSNDNNYGSNASDPSKVNLWAFGDNTSLEDLAVRTADGNVWVCGNTQLSGPAIALLKSDGSFANAGIINLSGYFPSTMTQPQVTAIALNQGRPVVAGTYTTQSGTNDIFLMQLKIDGTIDASFGPGNNGIAVWGLGTGNHYVHDLTVQDSKGILLYAYVSNAATLARFTFSGAMDNTFLGNALPVNNTYKPAYGNVTAATAPDRKLQVKVVNGFIYGLSTSATTFSEFLVFKLNEDGVPDAGFGNQGVPGYFVGRPAASNGCYPSSLVVRANGTVVVGGSQINSKGELDHVVALLKKDGSAVDSSFNTTGYQVIDLGSIAEKIVEVELENDNTIVAAGMVKFNGTWYQEVFRMTADGKADKTFGTNGYSLLNVGFLRNAAVNGTSLYLSSTNREWALANSYWAQVTKVTLGAGKVNKTTLLALPNYNKTFGDEAFKIQAVSNSSAKITYTVVQSGCATVDATTGEVTITCATADDDVPILVEARQEAINGYTAATATSIINVAKAFPKIYFPTQGGVTGSNFKLQAYSQSSLNDPTLRPYYTQYDGYEYFYYNYSMDSVEAYAEGEGQVEVYFDETRNYLSASKLVTIYIYDQPIAPVASDDAAELVFGQQHSVVINVLENDEAYSGTIVTKYPDLDPSTPGMDSVYVSPALGLFEADSNGIVTYTPFSGFIGSGEISYTIRDSKGLKSAPALIKVAVVSETAAPELKATEMITPNNDGLNEAFVIGYVDLEKENVLRIFDRNGQELFSQNNYKNDWTGTLSNGQQAESGIYYYVFTEGDGNGQRELKGVVELRR